MGMHERIEVGGERWEEVLLFHVQPLSFKSNDVDVSLRRDEGSDLEIGVRKDGTQTSRSWLTVQS